MEDKGNMVARNVPLFPAMKEIVDAHVKFYREDFGTDQENIRNALEHSGRNPVYYIWLARTLGTNLAYLGNALVRNSGAHSAVCYYYEQDLDGVKPFLIRAEKTPMGILGDICSLDYPWLYAGILSKAPYASHVRNTYRDGTSRVISNCPDPEARARGGVVWAEAIPDEPVLHAELSCRVTNGLEEAKHVNMEKLLEQMEEE